ncbi:MAG: ATP-binding protein [Gammaproteobacteria bacterium]|nr:ATP-binding protein [Gammaproteobacteria bacterium]
MRKRSFQKPRLILIMGVAGSGKTTLSREILRRVPAVYLDNNHIADAFFPHTRNGRSYEKIRPRFYQALYRITEANLKLGNSVLLDVPHTKDVQTRSWQVSISQLAIRSKAEMVVIWCHCSEKVLRTRIRSRGEARDSWKLKNWKRFLKREPIEVDIPFPHFDLNTEKNVSSNVNAAVSYIKDYVGQLTN